MKGICAFLCVFLSFFAHRSLYASDDIFSSAEVGYGSGVNGNKPLIIASFGLTEIPFVRLHLGEFWYNEKGGVQRETSFVGAGVVIEPFTLKGCSPWCPMNQFGLGVSYFDHPTDNFGSKWEFHVSAKFGAIRSNGKFYFLSGFDHWSTGGLTEKNIGETFFVFSAGYRF